MIGPRDRREYPNYPMVGVGAVVWKSDKFLLIKRGKKPFFGKWSIPGGRQELGESTKQAAAREVYEETSLHVKISNLIDVVDSIIKDETEEVRFHATLVDYTAEWLSGKAKAKSDAIDIAWHGIDELADLGLWSETTRVIQKSFKMRI